MCVCVFDEMSISLCSACACGMNEWSVECECGAGEWMSEWSADGMNVIMLHELRATQVENGTVLSCYEAYIYPTIGVCERDQRERDQREEREKTGIKSVRLQDCFRLH